MRKKQHLNSDEKLTILRACDPFREWHSLDDKRHCILCDKTITGRQIEVNGRGARRYELRCPTEGCRSSPHEWMYVGNPLISEAAWKDWERLWEEDGASAPSKLTRKESFCVSSV